MYPDTVFKIGHSTQEHHKKNFYLNVNKTVIFKYSWTVSVKQTW